MDSGLIAILSGLPLSNSLGTLGVGLSISSDPRRGPRLSVVVPRELLDALKRKAAAELGPLPYKAGDRAVAIVVRRLIQEYVSSAIPPPRKGG